MNQALYQSIAKSTAHRPSRDYHAALVFGNPALLSDLMDFALDVEDKNHHKACWILELVMEKNIEWLSPHLDRFCEALSKFTQDGAARSVSKICMFAATRHLKTNDLLSGQHLKKITEACFDWLIGDAKVATKAYAMRALLQTGKLQTWIYPELKIVLEMGYAQHSAAYQAASKEILKQIK
jgi:hypothetical protein